VGGEEEASGFDAGQRANVIGEAGREGKGRGAGGVAESIERPKDEDPDESDDGEGGGVVERGAGEGGLARVAWTAERERADEEFSGEEEDQHGGKEDGGVFGGQGEAGGQACDG